LRDLAQSLNDNASLVHRRAKANTAPKLMSSDGSPGVSRMTGGAKERKQLRLWRTNMITEVLQKLH